MSSGHAISGGALIGAASVLLLIANGRIAGISGIVAGLLKGQRQGFGWRLAFLMGLIAGPIVASHLRGGQFDISAPSSLPVLVLAGVLVGYGTRLGSGCTSGHGVSGLARLSPRSIAAVVTFLLAAIFTVFIMRHVLVHGS